MLLPQPTCRPPRLLSPDHTKFSLGQLLAHRCTHQGGDAGQWHRENRSRDDREAQRTVRPMFMGVGAGTEAAWDPRIPQGTAWA